MRAYSYVSGAYTLNDVRQIGAVIQPEVDHAVNGDTVLVAAGTYPEAVTVNKSVTITGAGPTTTIIDPPAGNGLSIAPATSPSRTCRLPARPTARIWAGRSRISPSTTFTS